MCYQVTPEEAELILHGTENEWKEYIMAQGRWMPALQPYILAKPELITWYAIYSLDGGRWPEGEQVLLQHPALVCDYTIQIIGGRWPEAEKVILNSGDPTIMLDYSMHVIMGRWREAEQYIKQDYVAYAEYRAFLRRMELCYDEATSPAGWCAP
jgi:hypothetical protein